MKRIHQIAVWCSLALSGCSASTGEELKDSEQPLVDLNQVLGFENVSGWSTQQGTIALSTERSQGVAALGLRNAYYADIVSIPLNGVGNVESTVSIDVRLPASVRTGTLKLIAESHQAGIYYTTLGQSNLASLPVSGFTTVTFPLDASVAARLRATYADLKIHIIVSATIGAEPIVFDNLRFASSPSRVAACSDPSTLLVNAGFEQTSGNIPSNWIVDTAQSPEVTASTVAQAGRNSSRALKLMNSGSSGTNARVFQSIALQPYTPYILRGFMRFESPRAVDGQDKIASLSADPYYFADVGPSRAAEASGEWREFSVDFETGYNGAIEIAAHLHGGGTVYFDDLKIECNSVVKRYESPHFILDLDPEKEAAAGAANVEKVVARTEEAILALAELTGQTALMNQWKQNAWGPARFIGGGVSGYPFLWESNADYLRTNWGLDAFLPEIFAHEMGHNFDSPNWEFNGPELAGGNEFNEFKAYYVYETRNFAIAEGGYARGSDMRRRYLAPYEELWLKRHCARPDALVYREILVKDKIGWEPYRQTYRYLLGAGSAELVSAWDRISLYHKKLAQYSGRSLTGTAADVAAGRALFGTDEWQWIETFYNHYHNGEPQSLRDIDATTKVFSLSDATWVSASAAWGDLNRNGQADGCPYATATRVYEKGLWAHATSEYVFDLGGVWKTFDTDFGISIEAQSAPVHFTLRDGDGTLLFDSGSVSDNLSRHATVDVTGKQRLVLRVDPVATSVASAWGLWLDPTVRR